MKGPIVGEKGWVALPLFLVVALCMADQTIHGGDYIGASGLVFQLLSFPVGWLFFWAARVMTQTVFPYGGALSDTILLVMTCIGASLNAYLLAAFSYWLMDRVIRPKPTNAESA